MNNKTNPTHYNGRKCMDAIIETLLPEGAIDFCLGNYLKYKYRGGKKDGESEEDDEAKAKWYMDEARRLAKSINGNFSFIHRRIKQVENVAIGWRNEGI